MPRFFATLLVGFVLGLGSAFAAYQLHVVRSAHDVAIVPKQSPTLADVYVDIRGWTHEQWAQHRQLARNLVKAGRGDLVAPIASLIEDPAPESPAPSTSGREHGFD